MNCSTNLVPTGRVAQMRREELDEERAGDEADLRCGAAQPLGGGQRQMQVGHDEPRPADRASGSGAVPGAKGGKMALPR